MARLRIHQPSTMRQPILRHYTNANLGSGGTHIDTALSSISSLITSVGTGANWNNTLPYVFLITDGAQDNQTKGVPNGSWSGSNQATIISPSTSCSPLKSRGVIVAVLYIPYQPLSPVNSSFAGDEDDAANNNIPSIPASLQGCASPGFFYTANSPTDITTRSMPCSSERSPRPISRVNGHPQRRVGGCWSTRRQGLDDHMHPPTRWLLQFRQD